MGLFGRITSAVGNGVRMFGHFGGTALNKIGQVKGIYDRINHSMDGIIGQALESIPVVGPVLKKVGSFLNDSGAMGTVRGVLSKAHGIGDDIERFGKSHGG